MWRIARICAVSLAAALLLESGSAAARTRVVPGWVVLPVRLSPSFTPSESTNVLRLTVTVAGCGPTYSHARLRWQPHRLLVTLLAQPHRGVGAVCPQFIAIVPVKVRLGRALGDRAIYDAGSVPPRPVSAAPGG